jgi:hypothetical protein
MEAQRHGGILGVDSVSPSISLCLRVSVVGKFFALATRYNAFMADTKPFRLTESVKAAG